MRIGVAGIYEREAGQHEFGKRVAETA